ncbi:MAG TPA: transposase [Ktedonobacteraceae bacterium]
MAICAFWEKHRAESRSWRKKENHQTPLLPRRTFVPLPGPIREVLATFRPLCTAPTWRKWMTLLMGTLVAHGRRTVAAALRHSGNEMETHVSAFHQARNRARWSPLAVSRQLCTTIVNPFVQAGGTVELVIDETLERRGGPTISKRGQDRDRTLSRRKRSVSSPGLRWIVMAVGVTLPWTQQRGALPVVCADDDPRGECEPGHAAQDGRDVGAPDGHVGTPLVSDPAHYPAGRYRRPHPGTGPDRSGTAGRTHSSLSPGCGPA